MWKALKKILRAFGIKLDQKADNILSEREMIESVVASRQTMHKELARKAAVVVGGMYDAQMELARMEHVVINTEKDARTALELEASADEEDRRLHYRSNAQILAEELMAEEAALETARDTVERLAQEAEAAKQSVRDNARELQLILVEKRHLLSQVRQAELQEAVSAVQTEATGLPSLDDVRQRVQSRYAAALGTQDIARLAEGNARREIQRVSGQRDANARLAEMRKQMELPASTHLDEVLNGEDGLGYQ